MWREDILKKSHAWSADAQREDLVICQSTIGHIHSILLVKELLETVLNNLQNYYLSLTSDSGKQFHMGVSVNFTNSDSY